ncbi:hypothetical protein NQ318_006626 [Aromia moschata]|uniref:UDENN domain-containing protein n=1 Tax=Aromia moschata TaxID=1265417 RepID=A0AAV8XGW9_9CUCU|nr:hypothetical protein NQ318_006626 [Aromia moschata]
MHSSRTEDLREFLSAVYSARIADPGKKFLVPFNRGESTFSVDVPRPFQLPSIPENRNLTEYFNAVDTHNMIVIFASMLRERRIIFTSRKLKRLSACVQSANDIIYPMIWQHIFIPVLPMSLIDYLLAPMPFLIGVPSEVLKLRKHEIGDVVILDADANTVESPYDDLNDLPKKCPSLLQISSLKKQLRNKSLGDGVSRAFLRALVQLIGGYRDALRFEPGQKVTFDEDKFIETRPLSLQPFLRKMLELQIFQQGSSDEFEFELESYCAKSGSKLKQQYKEWTSTMKKEGSAFFKSVKDKANPAMKSAVKTVKDGGKGVKSAYKGWRSRLRDNQGPHQLQNGLDGGDKPRSAPNSPTDKRRTTIAGFSAPIASYRKEAALSFKNSSVQRSYSPLSPASQPVSPDVLDTSRSASPTIEIPRIDLMNEMEDLLQLRLDTPPVDRSVAAVRSKARPKSRELQKRLPLSSPERWAFPAPRAGPVAASPPARFFLHSLNSRSAAAGTAQETQNLLQSPDDVFLSPSAPPRVPPRDAGCGRDLFGTAAPFVVGGGHSENGDPLFFVANRHSVDIVKLSPLTCSPRRKRNEHSEDLIRLDSTSDIDDFDPLKSKSSRSSSNASNQAPLSLSNPLYTYENHSVKQNGGQSTGSQQQRSNRECNRNDQDLLQEYGLDFNFSSRQNQPNFDPFNINKVNSQGQWTKFE